MDVQRWVARRDQDWQTLDHLSPQFVFSHGALELPAIFLAGAAG